MTAYTIIPDTSIDGDSVADVALLTALRDNAIAVGEADSTVPSAARVGKTNAQIFTANGTWTKPANLTGNEIIEIEMWGGGGGSNGGGGGGGGAYACRRVLASELGATESVVVGAGGASVTPGGTSYFRSSSYIWAHGGNRPTPAGLGAGGGGNGQAGSNREVGSTGYGGTPGAAGAPGGNGTGDAGGGATNSTTSPGGNSFYGGGGGGSNGAGGNGGSSVYGGGGGGTVGGASVYGGAGGNNAQNGNVPGGGAGGTASGAPGEVRVRVLA